MRHRSSNAVHPWSDSCGPLVVVVVGVVGAGTNSVVFGVDSVDGEGMVSEEIKEGGKVVGVVVVVADDDNFSSMAARRKAKAKVNTTTRQTAEQYLTSCHTVIGSSSNKTIGRLSAG